MKKTFFNILLAGGLAWLVAVPAFSQVIFQDGFESGSFNPTYWVPKPGTPSGLVTVAGTTLGGCVAFNRTGNYGAGLATSAPVSGTTTINGLWLKLDLAPYQGQDVVLSFWMKDAADFTNTEDAIHFSNDGGTTWSSQIFPLRTSEYTDNWGQFPPIHIGRFFADKPFTNNCVIRFSQRGNNDFNCTGGTQGYVIDDVLVQVCPVEYANLPVFDDFEDGLPNHWKSSNPFYDGYTIYKNNAPERTSRPDGVMEVGSSQNGVNFDAVSGTKVLSMGKRYDSSNNADYVGVAADLHLNLQGHTKVELSYWLKDLDSYSNLNLEEIGIFLSDDGGLTFTKKPVFDWRFNYWTDYLWGKLPPLPLDKLAAVNDLTLTNKFVVRFQAKFNRDFNPSGGSQGILLDNVEVKVPSSEYAEVPYSEDFEAGPDVLDRFWHYVDPYFCGLTMNDLEYDRPEGFVDVTSSANGYTFQAHSGSKVLALGGRTVLTLANFRSNAVDFRVKLAGKDGVKLSFWIRDFASPNYDWNAVYFSNNGGQTFQRARLLNLGSAPDVWWQVTLDVSQLCTNLNMGLTDQFVIRFQEYGKGNFISGAGAYIIDDVNICTSPPITSITPTPTTCGLNNGKATVNFNGSSAGFTYDWSGAASN